MSGTRRIIAGALALVGMLLGGISLAAQSSQSGGSQSGQSGQSAPPAQQPGNKDATNKDAANTLTLDTPPPPVNAEEDAAFKAYDAVPLTDVDKKTKAGEDFAQKYPQSRYLVPVYSMLVKLYMQANAFDKMQVAGEKEIALNGNDIVTLAILGQALPRHYNPGMPNAAQEWDKAEKFSKSAIELAPTLPKPDGMSDAQFTGAKNQTLAMAHSGLGLVYFRHNKFDQAIPEFEESVKVDPNPEPDPVTFYLLGIADEKTSHFDDAVKAFAKCSSVASGLQDTCKTKTDEAKKLGATQLSAPK